MKHDRLYYSIGALLYCPANRQNLAASLIQEKFGSRFSLALCLEDTIGDDCVAEAEHTLIQSLQAVEKASEFKHFYIPKIFIRVRKAAQIPDLLLRLGSARSLVTGFILPKFSLDNADLYIHTILEAGRQYERPIYMMPILESPDLIPLTERSRLLYSLKEKLDAAEELVLNIRVGGNDLCHQFGFRRRCDESIHDIRPISNIFSDILTVFGRDYVVSGPVWEYYDQPGWDSGLRRELRGDRLLGFIGKTVIHPKQIELVNQAYQVPAQDLADAQEILQWDLHSASMVHGSSNGSRMNEYKTHSNWAEKILLLAEVFGVQEEACPKENSIKPYIYERSACIPKKNLLASPNEKIITGGNIWSSTDYRENTFR